MSTFEWKDSIHLQDLVDKCKKCRHSLNLMFFYPKLPCTWRNAGHTFLIGLYLRLAISLNDFKS